jgi:CRP-like cAMP-binding protein
MMTSDYGRNRLLRLLPVAEAERLARILEPVKLHFKEAIYASGKPIEYVYFPLTGVVSLVMDMEGGQSVEAGTIGREGMTGLLALLGSPNSLWRALSQIPGDALRAPIEAFREEARRAEALGQLLRRYTVALIAMLAQTAACNRLHSLEERMCRWLLMTRDRVDADEFPLTQDFLGQMLGVRRPSVSLASAALQNAGLIKYSRGQMFIANRTGLESASCECYRIVRRHYEEALSPALNHVSKRGVEVMA